VSHARCGKLVVASAAAQSAGAAGDRRARARQRRGRPALHRRRRARRAGAGAAGHGRAAVALHRHRRQPRPDAVAARRRRAPRRDAGARQPGAARAAEAGGIDCASAARPPPSASARGCGQRRGAGCPRSGARSTAPGRAPRARRTTRAGCISAGRAGAVLAPDVPDAQPAGLGVHFTLDLGGQAPLRARRGLAARGLAARPRPTTRWTRARRALRRRCALLVAGAARGALQPAYSRRAAQDRRPRRAGRRTSASTARRSTACRGWCNLFGIESPGLTACLAIGARVAGALA
jgi:hypothetical protein